MTLPRLTHLQFLVLNALERANIPGRDVRAQLREAGVRQSGPADYQMMAGLEDKGYVAGRYEQQVVDGQIFRERHYKILASGRKVWTDTRDFYRRALAPHAGLLGPRRRAT
jgi:DNA-binding MarR family transcriptional regulator